MRWQGHPVEAAQHQRVQELDVLTSFVISMASQFPLASTQGRSNSKFPNWYCVRTQKISVYFIGIEKDGCKKNELTIFLTL